MKLIVGLGNPGKQYLYNRHNLGYLFIDRLAEIWNFRLKTNRKLNSGIVHLNKAGNSLILAKPLTFVNDSGISVNKIMKFFSVPLSDILIVYDDFSLPLGVTRLRMKGSSGGHNGINSIIEELKTAEFPRLKLGIGPVPEESIAKEFVLTDFAENEKAIIDKMFSGAITIVEKFILS